MTSEERRELVHGLAQGNPGAMSVIVRMLRRPDGESLLAKLVDRGLKGPGVWMLFKDEHGEDLEAMCATLARGGRLQ